MSINWKLFNQAHSPRFDSTLVAGEVNKISEYDIGVINHQLNIIYQANKEIQTIFNKARKEAGLFDEIVIP